MGWVFAVIGIILGVLALATQKAGGAFIPLALAWFGGAAAAAAGALMGDRR